MKARTSLFLALTLVALGTSSVQAEGFKIEGESLETLKLIFDAKGIDRSSPEKLAESLLKVRSSLRSNPVLELTFQRAELNSATKIMKPVLTDAAFKKFYKRQLERVEKAKASVDKFKVNTTIKMTSREEEKDGRVVATFEVNTSSSGPCMRCDSTGKRKTGKDCFSCKGTGTRSRDRKEKMRVQLIKKGDTWMVKALQRPCWGCNGTGKAKKGRFGKTGPGAPAPGGPADEAPKDCTRCSATGFQADSFLRGPKTYTNMPKIDSSPKVDLSSADKAFKSFATCLKTLRILGRTIEGRMAGAWQTFVKAYLGGEAPAPKTREFKMGSLDMVDVGSTGDTTAFASYRRVSAPGQGPPGKGPTVNGKVEFEKGADGKWRVSGLQDACWCARRSGQPRPDCGSCKGAGFRPSNYLPYF